VIREPDWTDDRWCAEVARANAAVETFRVFYRRWCLERFLTWDLPQPLRPEFSGSTILDTFTLSEAGVHIFLPWHLLRDHEFTLRDLAKHLNEARNPAHLKDWLEKGRDELGYLRFSRLYMLYRYRHLAIAARYPGRILGNTEALDYAFAVYMANSGDSDQGTDTIKKARLDLIKRLRLPTRGD
jgi:hypothetical protein